MTTTTRAVDIPGVRIAMACVQRVDQGHDKPLDLTGCREAVAHPTDGAKRAELVEAIAYLSAQVVGYQNAANRDATLAMSQIRRVVDEYEKRHP